MHIEKFSEGSIMEEIRGHIALSFFCGGWGDWKMRTTLSPLSCAFGPFVPWRLGPWLAPPARPLSSTVEEVCDL